MRKTLLFRHLLVVAAIWLLIEVVVLWWHPSGVWYVVAGVAFAAAVAALVVAAGTAFNATGKVGIMVEALRNNDFSLRFPDKLNPEINNAFSDIAFMIKEEKIKARQRDNYYGLIINRVSAGVFVMDENGNVELCNDSALRLLGMHVFTHASQLDRREPGLYNSLRSMTTGDTSLISFLGEHGPVSVSVVFSSIKLGDEVKSVYVLNNVYSVIDRREVEAWIKLTRVLTHEIMNSIAPIHALSTSLLEEDCNRDDTMARLRVINTTAAGLMNFTSSFRKFAAIPVPEKRLNYVDGLVRRAVSLCGDMLDGVECTVDVAPPDLIVESDEGLICQVLVNLLKNAKEAGATKVLVKAGCDAKGAVGIDVSDNGEAIPPECMDQIFVPFFTTKSGGSGIGLSVSRRIMNLHGGSMSVVQSRRIPYAKTFRLRFP